MGNTNCVAPGATPHLMVMVVINSLPYDLNLDTSVRCPEVCKRHYGFGASNGKFVDGWTPISKITPNSTDEIRVSGRSGSAVNAAGFIFYRVSGTDCQVKIEYEASGQNRAHNGVYFIGSGCQDGSGRLFARAVTSVSDRRFQIELKVGGSDNIEAGERSFPWQQFVSELFNGRPTSVRGLSVLITDQATIALGNMGKKEKKKNKLLQYAWKLGALVGGFDIVVHSSRSDGFELAINEVAARISRSRHENKVIGEVQIWSHGSNDQRVFGGSMSLNTTFLKPLYPYTRSHSVIWFRSCNVLADYREGSSPGAGATKFAQAIKRDGDFGVVGGHTVIIGISHTQLYAYINGRWYGPESATGKSNERLVDNFPSIRDL